MRGKQPLPKVEDTEAESEQSAGTKSHKTRAQKDKHNATCRESRLKIKEKRKMLEETVPKLQAENKKMKMDLEEVQSKFREKEIEIQQLKRNLEAKKARDEWFELMSRQILPRLKVNGQSFTSFDEMGKCLASQDYVQDCQVSGTSGNVLHGGNEFAGLGAFLTDNLPPSMADLYQKNGFGQDHANITAFSAVGPSFDANHAFSAVGPSFDANHAFSAVGPSFDANHAFLSHTPDQGYTSTTASAALGSFSVANHGLPVYDTRTSHHGLVNTNITFSAVAGSSSVAKHGLPVEPDTPTSQHGQEHTNITSSAAVSCVSDGVPTGLDSSLWANPETLFDQTNIPECSGNIPNYLDPCSWFQHDFDYQNHWSLYGYDPKAEH